jgi:hypothetical protein
MPILPLDHPEPFAATLGVMLYPGPDGTDPAKAAAFATQYLAKPIGKLRDAGGTLGLDDAMRLLSEGGERLDDLDRRWWQGTTVGEIFKIYFALWNTDPVLASWENATGIAQRTAAGQKQPGSRSALLDARRRFRPVAHLWAAWCIRAGEFSERPAAGYDYWHDFQSFLAEAEFLRLWGQTWRAPRSKAVPPLPKDAWQVPDDWSPPERLPGWPPTGQIPDLKVPDELMADLRRPGRPRK